MSTFQKILKADSAGPSFRKLYDQSHFALAGLVPVALITKEGDAARKAADIALGLAIPLHAHVGLNTIFTDYVPPAARGASRWVAVACTGVALLGFLKLNIGGPGITATVEQLWKKKA